MLLELTDINKTFDSGEVQVKAVQHLNLSIGEFESVGLIGESGSGKTTVANMVIGLERPTSGSICYQGAEIALPQDVELSKAQLKERQARAAEFRRDVQMVFQHPAETFSERMTLGAGIEEGVIYRKQMTADERRKLMYEALEMVRLPASYAKKYAWEVSGGECQRAAFARAIISRPKLLLCDEPTSALDVTVQAQIIELLIQLSHELRMSCLFISHDLALVRGLCSRVYVMKDGVVVEQGETKQLFEHPQDPYTVELLSSVLDFRKKTER